MCSYLSFLLVTDVMYRLSGIYCAHNKTVVKSQRTLKMFVVKSGN